MRQDTFSFSVKVETETDSAKIVVIYAGRRYEKPRYATGALDYYRWICSFSSWVIGPSPSFCDSLRVFCNALIDVTFPNVWTSHTWDLYVEECQQSLGSNWEEGEDDDRFDFVDEGDLRGRISVDEVVLVNPVQGDFPQEEEGEGDGW